MSYQPETPTSDIGQDAQAWLAREFEAIQQTFLDLLGGSDIGAMVWRGVWEDREYYKNEVVTQDGWLAIANKNTIESPAPQQEGDPINVIEIPGSETFSVSSVSASSLFVGTRYTFPQDAYVRQIRVYIPNANIGFKAEFWIVTDSTTNPSFRQAVGEFTITANDVDKWLEFPIGLTVIQDGTTFDVVGLYKPAVGATSFTYEWDYKRKNGDPSSGEIWHQSGANADQMRVNQNDESDTNRSTDLDNIGPGSDILMVSSGMTWDVLDASKSGSVYTFLVDPAERAGEDSSNFTFTYYAPLAISYVVDANHYSTLTNVNGFLSTTGYDPSGSGVTLDNNAYGIDITVQDVLQSEDWDLMAYSG